MGSFIRAAGTGEFQDGTKRKVVVDGHEILLARVGESYYAVSNRCPHMGGNLAAGTLEGTVITCPLHGSRFDITDGSVVRWLKGKGVITAIGKALKSPDSLTRYNVKIEGDDILIET
jgi:nitrite reductase/ring-hydroxylating ferredoxin subunit